MTGFSTAVMDYCRRHLPESARQDAEAHRRALTGLAFALIFLSQVPLFAAMFWFIGQPVCAVVVLIAGLALGSAPALIKRSYEWGNRFVLLVIWLALYATSYYTGGPRSPMIYWTVVVPIMALMAGSIRDAQIWLGGTVLVPIGATLAERFGMLYSVPEQAWQAQTLGVVALGMLAVVLSGLAFSYESGRAAMVLARERITRDMRLVLDNVEQGFVTFTRGGELGGMRSAIVEKWLGAPAHGETISDWLARADANTAAWLRLGIDEIFDGFLPLELSLSQLPQRAHVADRVLEISYRMIHDRAGAPHAIVAILSDATERLHAERSESVQRELVAFFTHLMRDRDGVLQFFAEAGDLVKSLDAPGPNAFRYLHTLKGNAGLFGLHSLAAVCHAVETEAQQDDRGPNESELASVRAAWSETALRVAPLLADQDQTRGIHEDELLALEQAIREGASGAQLLATISGWRREPAAKILGRLAEQAVALGKRLGRCEVVAEVRDHDLRFDRNAWAPVWSAMVHAIRNAVDHGGEPAAQRQALGKAAALHIVLESVSDTNQTRITIADDGAGIDWDRVRARAASQGLPHETPENLHEALFADGLSTRETATDLSGRGVGLAALREACRGLGGTVTLQSQRGHGTRLVILAPVRRAETSPARTANPRL